MDNLNNSRHRYVWTDSNIYNIIYIYAKSTRCERSQRAAAASSNVRFVNTEARITGTFLSEDFFILIMFSSVQNKSFMLCASNLSCLLLENNEIRA